MLINHWFIKEFLVFTVEPVLSLYSSGVYSRRSPGWQSSFRQMHSRVVKRITQAFLVFKIDRLGRMILIASARPTHSTGSSSGLRLLSSLPITVKDCFFQIWVKARVKRRARITSASNAEGRLRSWEGMASSLKTCRLQCIPAVLPIGLRSAPATQEVASVKCFLV